MSCHRWTRSTRRTWSTKRHRRWSRISVSWHQEPWHRTRTRHWGSTNRLLGQVIRLHAGVDIAVAAAIAALVVGGAAFWYYTHTPAEAVAGTAATAAPSVHLNQPSRPFNCRQQLGNRNPRHGRRSRSRPGLRKVRTSASAQPQQNSSPAHWSCTTPITVRLAGDAPAGADQALAEAVEAIRRCL